MTHDEALELVRVFAYVSSSELRMVGEFVAEVSVPGVKAWERLGNPWPTDFGDLTVKWVDPQED